MARHNYVFMYGSATTDPLLAQDNNGNYTSARMVLTTVRGERTSAAVSENDIKSYKFDTPVLLTKDPYLMAQISELKKNDIIIVKGFISSKNALKKTRCSVCGTENIKPGTITYITPVYIKHINRYISTEDALEDLKRNCEISNQCIVIGNLCENPKFYKDEESGNCTTQYNIAINRKFRVKTDPATLDTDYPHVKSYGEIAINDSMFLQTGSSIMIDGYLQTRKFDKKCTCANCGSDYTVSENAMEIVPYASEYLLNCRTVDEIETLKEEQKNRDFVDIFGVRPDNQ